MSGYVVSCAVRILNVSSVEQIRRKRSARLKGIAFFVCRGWQDEYSRCWCLSVGLVYRSVLMFPSLVKETLTSRKDTLVEECELVNLMVG